MPVEPKLSQSDKQMPASAGLVAHGAWQSTDFVSRLDPAIFERALRAATGPVEALPMTVDPVTFGRALAAASEAIRAIPKKL